MTTYRRELKYWTVVRSVDERGELRETTCCCAAPGSWRSSCAKASGNKMPCRCACHLAAPKVLPPGREGQG